MPDQLRELATLDLAREQSPTQLNGSALTVFENDVLPAFLPQQRWFADKDASLGAIRLVDAALLGGDTQVELTLIEIEQAQRMYFVPVATAMRSGRDSDAPDRATLARVRRGAQSGLLIDAFTTDALPLALVDDIRTGRRRASSRGGSFVAHAAAALSTLELGATPAVRRLSVEQSNTSVVVGEAAMLKGYRRVHRGPQPELEIARFLDAVGYQNTPALLGYLEYEDAAKESIALCILQRFVASQGDGWGATLAYLERYFNTSKSLQMPEQAAADNEHSSASDPHASFTARMRTLGRRTAELHRAFATPIGDPAFEPEPTTVEALAAWGEQARATAQAALTALERRRDRVPAELREDTDALLARRTEIMNRLAPPSLDEATGMLTRYHGDYHLGQVLVVGDDFMIVDFEGEPGRDAVVRRRKSSPLRDVAGMLRSINYAAVAGVRGVTTDRSEARADLEPLAREWEQHCVAAFLDGYRATIAGCASFPSDPNQAQRLLELFVLEKAFYEMSYELANRPSWLRIPLEGIRAILDAEHHAFSVN